MCTRGFVLQSDWYHQTKAAEVDNFYPGCYQALSSPCFQGEPGNEAILLGRCGSLIVHTSIYV